MIEINQARALAGGVTPGDAAGFPVSITLSGSYRLTGNLDVRSKPTPQNVTAIDIQSDDVTVDLGGFTIRGPNTVSNFTVCTAGATAGDTGYGIRSAVGVAVVVRNGRLRGMGADGVSLDGRLSRIEGVIAEDNCGRGLDVLHAGLIVDSQARANSSDGISSGMPSRVQDSVADLNGGDGIFVGPNSIVTGCAATSNRLKGIRFVGSRGVAIGNAAALNSGSGILGGGGVTVVNNAISDNVGFGVAGDNDGVGGNVFKNNDAGASYPGGLAIGCNLVDTTVFCPSP